VSDFCVCLMCTVSKGASEVLAMAEAKIAALEAELARVRSEEANWRERVWACAVCFCIHMLISCDVRRSMFARQPVHDVVVFCLACAHSL
jgi:hypothetical protein